MTRLIANSTRVSTVFTASLTGSAADVAGVEAAGYGGVGGAFYYGAAVGEESDFVGVAEEFQDEVIVADIA